MPSEYGRGNQRTNVGEERKGVPKTKEECRSDPVVFASFHFMLTSL